MKTVKQTRNFAAVLVSIMSFLYMDTGFELHAQSPNAQTLVERLLSTEKRRLRYLPRVKLAREIANDRNLSPKVRVDVLTTVLREELENPCPGESLGDGKIGPPTAIIQKRYVFCLEDIGSRAIPHLRKHLIQLKLSVQNISPSLGNTDSVDAVEMQHIQCALGLLADKDVLKDLIKILEDEDGDGYIRQMAAVALGNIGDKLAIPALKRALNDDFHVNYTSLWTPQTVYPVREATSSSLRKLGVKIAFEGNSTYRVVR